MATTDLFGYFAAMDQKLPDDGFSPEMVLPMGPAPEPEFDESICLKGAKGKCDYLWQRTINFDAGNPKGTFAPGTEPREILRGCLRDPSGETPLNGLTVFTCDSHSDPTCRVDPRPFVFDEPDPKLANLPLVRLRKDPSK